MKIDIRLVVADHFRTLYNARTKRVSFFDLILFYLAPACVASMVAIRGFDVGNDAYNVSITFFGIFIALLLNIQVALFSILQRRWIRPTDERSARMQDGLISERSGLLRELNSNISYLILVCCLALFAALLFYMLEWKTGSAPALMVFFYLHFLLTVLMIIKRAHALFQKEYHAPTE